MANIKITELPNLAGADVAEADVFVIDDVTATESKKITVANLAIGVGAAGFTASRALTSDGSGNIAVSDVTSTELGYLDGVSSAIQTQLDAKIATTSSASNDYVTYTQLNANLNTTTSNVAALETRRTNNIAGAISSILTSDLTASRAMVSDGSGKIAVLSSVTSTELGYVDATSSIQTQLDAKAALAGATFTGQVNFNDDAVVTGNLSVHGDTITANAVNLVVQDQFIALSNGGTSSMDVGIFYNRGTEGNAAIWYDASTSSFYLSETKDPFSNTTVKPTSAANLNVGALTISSITLGATALTATGTELNYVDGVSSAIQTQLDAKQATITGGATTIDTEDLTASRALVSSGSGKVAISAVTSTEVGYLDGVSSAIQTQLDAKQATITGGATTIDTEDLTASRALVSSGSGKVEVSAVTATEIGYLDGVTSSIQTQIDAAQTTFANAHYTTTSANSYNIGTTVANINETDVFLDGIYQIKNQYVLANSSHNVQFKEATFTAGVGLEIVSHT